MASLDDDHPGTRNGGHGRRRRPRALDDERPRGFQPQRMRRLWDDIDEARDKLGLGAASAAPSPGWSVGTLVGRALEATAGATNRALEMTAGATKRALEVTAGATTWVSALVPASVERECSVTGWLAQVPIVGRLLALLPGVAARAD